MSFLVMNGGGEGGARFLQMGEGVFHMRLIGPG